MVANKLKEFCRCFSQRAQVQDLLSKKILLTDTSQVRTRYQTVFRESGEELQVRCARLNKRMLSYPKSLTPLPLFCPFPQMAVLSRAVFFPREGSSAPSDSVLVLDLERHLSLVTPVGASLDGALGLRGPRRQELWALYSVCNGQIDGIWLTPAAPSPPSQQAGSSNGSGGSSRACVGLTVTQQVLNRTTCVHDLIEVELHAQGQRLHLLRIRA